MENNRKRLMDTFEKLDPMNRAEVMARANLILTIQESTKRRMLERLLGPEYAERGFAPVGSVGDALAKEAV